MSSNMRSSISSLCLASLMPASSLWEDRSLEKMLLDMFRTWDIASLLKLRLFWCFTRSCVGCLGVRGFDCSAVISSSTTGVLKSDER